MALKPIILIGPSQGAEVSEPFDLVAADIPATLMADGLSASETVIVFRVTDAGTSGEDAFQDGLQVTLTSVNNTITVNSPMRIGVRTVGGHSSPVTVYLSTQGFV